MSSRTAAILISVFVAWSVAAVSAAAGGTVQFQLGEQDFADGRSPVLSSEIRAAGAGEAYPFDGTIFGNDVKSKLGAFEFAHTFDLAGDVALRATLTLGLIDVDSPASAPLETVALWLDGVAQSSETLTGISPEGTPSSAEVIEFAVPTELLGDGSLRVTVVATRPGSGNLGNAIEPDFSRLMVETAVRDGATPIIDPPSPAPVPLPPALIPAGVLLASLAACPKGRLRRWLRM